MTRKLRFVHAADLHLDSPFKGLVHIPDTLREQVIASTFQAWDQLVELAIQKQADAVLLCGDMHDSAHRSLRAQWRLQQGLERLCRAGVRVFMIHGNHDPLTSDNKWNWPEGVTVMGTEQPDSHFIQNRHGERVAVVTGMSYGSQAVYTNLASLYPFDPEKEAERNETDAEYNDGAPTMSKLFRIGMLHGTLDGREEHDPYAPCSKQELLAKGYQYWALGHIHKREIANEYPHMVYPGNIQGRHVKESGKKGAYVVDVEQDNRISMQFHPLDTVRWLDCKISIEAVGSRQEMSDLLLSTLDEMRQAAEGRTTLARITFFGRTSIHHELTSGTLLKELEETWKEAEEERLEHQESLVWPVQLRVDSRAVSNIEAWRESEHFIGDLVRMAESHAEVGEGMQSLIDEAIGPMLQQRRLVQWLEEQPESTRAAWLEEAMHLVVGMLEGETDKL
ncbi:DNA repair exonuclease [Paenibacillus sp. ACRRX]|uniref:metallophosphoesterase family protein n=1 Tax=Paenibacillus sp. ACRRX TaxID=2918206 RepID=UPI001EF6C423|nr:DNA repair exonuclease [Paenibacillus sp. ACRRX]MCG7406078.1 DNA repair exonuclease [Paenibacillus sp. ACRRX]